jgi:hypothetical protein
MSPKAAPKKTSPVQPTEQTPAVSGRSLAGAAITSLAILLIAAVASPVSQLNLSPVFGSIPSSIYHQSGITLATLTAFIIKKALKSKGLDPETSKEWIAPLALYTPIIQFLIFQRSGGLGPEWGPLITETLTFFPVLFLSLISVSAILEGVNLHQFGITKTEAPLAVLAYGIFHGLEAQIRQYIPLIIGKVDWLSRVSLQLIVGTAAAAISNNKVLFAIPAILHTLMSNPHYTALSTTKLANVTLAASEYTLLERHDSITGYLSVLENKKEAFVALRCDHSLLGGEWLVTPERIHVGQNQRETIYSVFTMLEAVRLVKTDYFAPDDEKSALFM